jgi:ketosteroid isomerase-like protein
LFTGLFKTMKVSKYKCRVSEAEIYGNVVYDRGECEWESVTEGQSPLRWQGRYYAVRHRGADGVWRLHRLIENELPSHEAASDT